MQTLGPNPLLDLLRRELRSGERLLWAGQPDPGPLFRKGFGIYFFAVPWTAFSLFWEGMVLSMWFGEGRPDGTGETGMAAVMTLFGLPFVLIGLGMLAAPFWTERKARRTIYGVTETRLIALTGGSRTEVRSIDAKSMGPISRRERRNGRGTLSIETGSHRDSDGDRVTDKFELEEIEDVAKVEELAQRIKDAGTR